MQKASNPLVGRRSVVFFLTALLVIAADQLSKWGIRENLAVGESIPETGFFQLTHVRNTGGSFGLFQGHTLALTIVAIIGIALLLIYALFVYHRYPSLDNRLSRIALGLILGGTIGNLIDRLTTDLHYVTDFINIGAWPAFNIADAAIVVGAVLFAFSLLSLARAGKH